jgi:hypothetical protein
MPFAAAPPAPASRSAGTAPTCLRASASPTRCSPAPSTARPKPAPAPNGGTWTRHRYDNSLATRMLARLDAQADDPAAGPAHRAARMVAQEFDTLLDLLARDAGPARAALFLAACADLKGGANARAHLPRLERSTPPQKAVVEAC